MNEYNFDIVVDELNTYFKMRCSPPRLLVFKEKYRILDDSVWIVVGECGNDFILYCNEEKHNVVESKIVPKYKLPLIYDLVKGYEHYCLCESLGFLQQYHRLCCRQLEELQVFDTDDSDSSDTEVLEEISN